MDVDSLKRAAGEAAATLVENGMVVGLGTGSTAKFAVAAIGTRVKAGLKNSGHSHIETDVGAGAVPWHTVGRVDRGQASRSDDRWRG